MTDTRTDFPIMGSKALKSIPWRLIAPHEKQAETNHGQTLKRLAERGGLDPREAWAVMSGRRWGHWRDISLEEAEQYLVALVKHD